MGSHERVRAEVEAVARGPHADAVRASRGGCCGRGREGRGVDAQGFRHIDGRHLLRVRGHGHPHLHVPPHGHLRAPHQAPGLPAGRLPRRCGPPLPPPAPAKPLSRQAPEPAHGGVGAAGGGPVGADAGAAVPDVPGAAGAADAAAAAVLPQGRGALAAARPPPLLHATLTIISATKKHVLSIRSGCSFVV